MQIALALQQLPPTRGFGDFLGLNGFLDFLKFVQNESVFRVAVSVVLDEEFEGLLLSTHRHEESRSFWHKLNGNENLREDETVNNGAVDASDRLSTHVDGHGDLDQVRNPPTPRRRKPAGTKDDPVGNDGSENPVRVPGMGHGDTVSGMSDFLNDRERGQQERGESESDDDPAGNKDYKQDEALSDRRPRDVSWSTATDERNH